MNISIDPHKPTESITPAFSSEQEICFAPEQEIRFAIVMYGGVSLAVYINGVSQELLRLVRATAPNQPTANDPQGLRLSEEEVRGKSEAVYRKLGRMLGAKDKAAGDISADDPVRTRFVVDIISGTSAGGINGIYLAKALANDQDLTGIKQLWKDNADLGQLLNDKQAIKGMQGLRVPDPPTALLSSQRIYRDLLDALEQMETGERTQKDKIDSPFADEIDLFVTTTDIYGLTLPIRLADKVVYEQRYKSVFHFRYATTYSTGEQRNDFHAGNHPFLAFAARCTSAFPFAFDPMSLADIDEVLRGVQAFGSDPNFQANSSAWKEYYRDYLRVKDANFPMRPFGDGGYLDNHPFSYAIDALQRRSADVPTKRKLLYVEPSPDHPEKKPAPVGKPDFAENVLKALIEIPRSETIREDLQRTLDRNRLIDRLSRITSNLESDVSIEHRDHWARLSGEDWAKQDLRDMIEQYGAAYGAYHRLKVYAVTDDIAKLITRMSADLDENSDQFLAVRYLVRAWREGQYVEYLLTPSGHPEAETSGQPAEPATPQQQTQNRFLLDFDLGYRLRRLNFVRRKIDEMHRLDPHAKDVMVAAQITDYTSVDQSVQQEFRHELVALKRKLSKVFVDLRQVETRLNQPSGPEGEPETGSSPNTLNPCLESLAKIGLSWDQVQSVLATEFATEEKREAKAAAMIKEQNRDQRLREFASELEKQFLAAFESASKGVDEILDSSDNALSAPAQDARQALRVYYDRYERYDMITFPTLYGTGVGEPVPIDVYRVSPEDAIIPLCETINRKKLAGTTFGHFGAFLQRFWRVNDMLWGRLDGAERIIRAVTPDLTPGEQNQLISEAQHAIINEELREEDRQEITRWLVAVLTRMTPEQVQEFKQHPDATALLRYIKDDLKIAGLPGLSAVFRECLNDAQLIRYLGTGYTVDTTLVPEPALRLAARSSAVIGKMLDGLASNKNVKNPVTRLLARIGQIAAGIAEAALPQSMFNLLFRQWIKLLYLFECLLILGGIIVAMPEAVTFGTKLLWLTLAVHLIIALVNERMRDEITLWKKIRQAFVFIVIIVFCYGAYSASRDIVTGFNFLQKKYRQVFTVRRSGGR